ncbi:MAG: sulfatase [Planctomycetaceae bacterium]|nr:sulfatase [Planctomycetaceae bacterium]
MKIAPLLETWRFRTSRNRSFVPSILFLVCCTFPLAFCAAEANDDGLEKKRPNIILLLADDLGYGELGCQGNPQIPTPHIDSIARHGVRFTQGYVTASYCSPSRAGLLTGRYQTRFGYEKNPIGPLNDDPQVGLSVTETTIADQFRNAGYRTSLLGKWHLGGTAAYHPQRRGFEEFFGFLHEGHYFVPPPFENVRTWLRVRRLPDGTQGRAQFGETFYSTHMGSSEPNYDANNPILRGGQPVYEVEYLTDALTREAVHFIERVHEQPFFLYVAYNAVHSPMQARHEDCERFPEIEDPHRQIFAGMLYSLDQSVGQILKKVNQLGLVERTLIVFLSDNGGPTRELTSSNAPLRGEKGSLYEGGVRVPMLMQWPWTIPAGSVCDQPVISLDLAPTFYAATQIEHEHRHLDGVNLLPYLCSKQESRPHEWLFWSQNGKAALRAGDWKLVRNQAGRKEEKWELFRLDTDPAESQDLSMQFPADRDRLIANWLQIEQTMKAEAARGGQ